ncbi:MAG TPA: membrane protein insertase YidC [Candidatus Acidoferrum sp.]|nr:membrane protein insertase YidC [Candidatus Acidoferrum sp.]
MDRKTVTILAVAFGVLYLWMWGVGKFFPPVPLPPKSTNMVAGVTNQLPIGTNNTAPVSTAVAVPSGTNAPAAIVPPGTPEETLTLETADTTYTFTSHGGGLKRAQLKHYSESIRNKGNLTNELVTLNEHGRAAVLAMQADAALDDNVFTLTKTPTNTVIAEKVLPSGLRVVKQFEPASNYTLRAHIWLQNTATQTVTLPPQGISVGAAVPAGPEEDPMNSGLFWHNGQKAEHIQGAWFDNYAFACFFKRPRAEYDSGVNPVQWGAVHNQFFALAVFPDTNVVASQFKAWHRELPGVAGYRKGQNAYAFEGMLYYPATNIAPNQFVDRQFTIYAGPKQEKSLSQLRRQADVIMDFGFFSPISKVFLRSMNWLHKFMPYGIAIIVLTIIIKAVFWPLTAASTRSMKRMQALGPEMAKIKEKYKDDPVKANKKTMEFMREKKINPMNGCWPMLVQMPIFFALFRMIPNAIELRGTPFLWVRDLSRADTLFFIPGLDFPFNLLPLIMGVTMFWQARLTPPSPGMDPAQQMMMKYMPLIFLVFLYNMPSGLVLYWTVQNLLTILQTKLTKSKEAAATVPVVAAVPAKKKK